MVNKMTQKLKPITPPIDPAKAHLYVARNGVGVESIFVHKDSVFSFMATYKDGNESHLFADGKKGNNGFNHSQDLTHEIIPETEAYGLDWSGVVSALWIAAIGMCMEKQHNLEDGDADFKLKALAILQEFERKSIQTRGVCIPEQKDDNKPEETAPTEEPREFVIGEMYEHSEFGTMQYVGNTSFGIICNMIFAPENIEINTKRFSALAAAEQLKKHIPAPKTNEIDVWLNIYDNNDYHAYVHLSKQDADDESDDGRIACLHFKRTFTEGEGLQ